MPARTEPNAALASAFRQIRRREGLTQEAVAHRADLDTTTVSRIERALLDPLWSTIERMADGLGVAPLEVVALAERLRANQE